MPAPFTSDQILELLRDNDIVEGASALTADSDLYLAGLDSMALMQLLLQIELVLGVQIEPGEITRERFSSAGCLAGFLNERSKRAA